MYMYKYKNTNMKYSWVNRIFWVNNSNKLTPTCKL